LVASQLIACALGGCAPTGVYQIGAHHRRLSTVFSRNCGIGRLGSAGNCVEFPRMTLTLLLSTLHGGGLFLHLLFVVFGVGYLKFLFSGLKIKI
jgi:hypothetical protein